MISQWDFGGPVLLTPFELVSVESAFRLAGTFTWRGPFEPEADPQWQAFQRGDINEREYWATQAQKFAEVTGRSPEMASMMAPFYAGDEEEIIRPGARTLIRDAKAAGIRVGMHTNDLTSFHDREWIDRMSILKDFDVVVEGRRTVCISRTLRPTCDGEAWAWSLQGSSSSTTSR